MMAQPARPAKRRSGSAGAPDVAHHHAPRASRAYRTVPAPPLQPLPAQSDAVDARDLARRLEIYSIELQLRAQSRPGRSLSPPLRKRPPPDTPSTASSPEYNTAGTPGRQRNHYSRRESVVPDGAAKGVEAQRTQAKRTSTIEARPARGTQARPQSLHPDYVDISLTKAAVTASRRQSRYFSGVSIVPVAGDSPTVPTSQLELANLQTPQTSEEAVKVLAALTQHERMVAAQHEQSASRSRPMTASSAAMDSPTTSLSAYTTQHAAGSGAANPAQVHRSTLSTEAADANGVYTREGSYHSGRGREPGAQARAPMARGEKLRITVPEGTSSRTTAAQSPIKRGGTASSSGKRKSVVSLANTELTVPSFPNSPLPSPGVASPQSAGSSQPRYKSGAFDEEAFIAMVRKPRSDDAAKEADRRSRGVSTSMSTASHRLSAASAQALGIPIGQPVSVNTTEPAPAELDHSDESRKAEQKSMRSKSVKDAATDRSRPAETKKKPLAEPMGKPLQRTGSGNATSATASTPNKLRKTAKSPGNSRPPSRAPTVTSTKSRSRAASQVTSPLSISAIEQVNFPTPVPQTDPAAHALPKLQKPALAARDVTAQTTSHGGLAPSQSTPSLFPELAPDQSRSTLIPQAGSLSHSKSLGNFSRPNGHLPDKQVLPLTMPAPPDAVYRATARHRPTSSAASHPLRGVRSFQNEKGKAYDQTQGMTGGSLALLQKMEAEVARREGASRAASRAHSRVGSMMPHSRIASRASTFLGGWTYDDTSAGPHTATVEKAGYGAGAPQSKKKRGCLGCLG